MQHFIKVRDTLVMLDGPTDEDSFLPIAVLMGKIFAAAFVGIIGLSFVM